MAVQEKLYTAADLFKLSADDRSKHYELVQGRLIEMSPTGDRHGLVVNEIAYQITAFVKAHKLGRVHAAETGFQLSQNPDTVRAPDTAFTSNERSAARIDGYPTVVPDLAVEVVSPGNSQTEMHEKIIEYFDAGTRLVWIVYPKSRAIYVYTAPNKVAILGVDDTLDGENILPGCQIEVGELFAVLD